MILCGGSRFPGTRLEPLTPLGRKVLSSFSLWLLMETPFRTLLCDPSSVLFPWSRSSFAFQLAWLPSPFLLEPHRSPLPSGSAVRWRYPGTRSSSDVPAWYWGSPCQLLRLERSTSIDVGL